MERYSNVSGNSGVDEYEITDDSILVKFAHGKKMTYEYSYSSCGVDAVEEMKHLAISGQGLSTYIAQNRPGFSRKFS